jgi:hypothetical protein
MDRRGSAGAPTISCEGNMRWLHSFHAAAWVLCAWTTFVPAVHAALPSAANDTWIEIRSRRFRLFSNAGDQAAVNAVRNLERLSEALERRCRWRVEGGREVHVYLFRDQTSFKSYSPFRDDEYGTTAGFHVHGEDAEYIAFFLPPRETPMTFASHEYIHAVLSQNLGEIPLWLNEGLAEFYSTFRAKRQEADIGLPILTHVDWLKDHMLPMRDLFLMGGNSPDYLGGERRGTIYAQSWVIVHTLTFDQEQRFDRFVEDLSKGVETVTALGRVYGPGAVDSLERHIRERVRGRMTMPYTSVTFTEEFDQIAVQKRMLDQVETETILGELLAHGEKAQLSAAREHLVSAWNRDSTRVLPAALLGLTAERIGETVVATRWFDAVDRARIQSPRALGLAGAAMARRRLEREPLRSPAPGAQPEALRARAMLARAMNAQPEAVAWDIPFGLTFLDDSEVSDGVGALLQAQEMWPRRTEIVGALGVLALRSGNRGAALHACDVMPPGHDRPYWKSAIAYLVVDELQDESERLVTDGKAAEAESLVIRVGARVAADGASSQVDRLLTWIRSQRTKPTPTSSDGSAATTSVSHTAQSSSGNASQDPFAPIKRALSVDDYATAERLIERMQARSLSASRRAGLDSLAADARNRRRVQVANDLVRMGRIDEACVLFKLILDDHPRADLRHQVQQQMSQSCRN